VELSGRVLDNWVAKTSNLLQDELDAEPGMRLRLDLPAHWKSMILALAAWQLGMEVVLDSGDAELLATHSPESGYPESAFDAVIAVPLPALAMRWPGELPPGVVDFGSEVRSHGDVFMAHEDPDGSARAIVSSTGTAYAHADLLEGFAAAHDAGVRLLVRAADGLEAALVQSVGAWHNGGSVVLVHADVKVTDKLLSDERVQGE